MANEESINPFAPPTVSANTHDEPILVSTTGTSFSRTVLVWTVVCTVSAIPPFIWGTMQGSKLSAMIAGVLTFICIYVGGDYATRRSAFRRNAKVRRTLQIGYWTRLVVSVVFPVGMFLDIYAGLASALILEALMGSFREESFPFIYLMTIVTGVTINIVIFIYMVGVISIWTLVDAIRGTYRKNN